jgi:predicted choloylglycine hydrolase
MVNPLEQGKNRGKKETRVIRHALDELRRFVDFFDLKSEDFMKVERDRLKSVPERYLEECEGIAEGSGHSSEELLALNFSAGIRRFFRESCTAFAVPKSHTVDGSILLMKNRDLRVRRAHPQVFAYSRLDGYNGFMGVTSAGSVNWYQGVNEKGLVAFNTAVPHQPFKEAMSISVMIRRLLEECDSVDEALRFIEGNEHNSGSNLFLGNHERAVIVEVKSGFPLHTLEVKKPECRANRWLFHANRDNIDRDSILHRLQSEIRLERGRQLLKGEEKIGVEALQRFSRDHEHGPGSYSICRHPSFTGSPLEKLMASCTLSCQIFKVGEYVENYVSLGQPCQTDFTCLSYGQEITVGLASGDVWLENSRRQREA